jgi:hypothetical protein
MSSPKQKRVHYERGTKGGKSSHRNSRDSGVGSSSASDRASLGTSPEDEHPFSRQQIENQRHQLGPVKEALDAAYEKIRQLEEENKKLNDALTERNRENRAFKRENMDLLSKLELLTEEKRAKEKTRTGASSSSSSGSRTERASPPRRHEETQRRLEEGSQTSGRRSIRRESVHGRPLPIVPQAPYNPNPNPFAPITTRPSSGSYIVPIQSPVTYAPAPITYSAAPAYPTSPTTSNYPNDGRYHPHPL